MERLYYFHPLNRFLYGCLLSITNIVDDIESTYPNFIKTHPKHISDSKVIIAKEMMYRELQKIKDQIISTINRDKNIRENFFNNLISKENLARFTIKNILSAKTKEDKEVLVQIVKCAIY